MFEFKIDVTDLEAKLAKLNTADFARTVADAVDRGALQPALRNAPPARHARQPFKSTKQRRAFFAMLRRGQIRVPYVRTGTATNMAKWPISYTADGLSRSGAFPYADLLRTRGKQAAYHAGNWKDLDSIAQEAEARAEVEATAAVVDLLSKAGLT